MPYFVQIMILMSSTWVWWAFLPHPHFAECERQLLQKWLEGHTLRPHLQLNFAKQNLGTAQVSMTSLQFGLMWLDEKPHYFPKQPWLNSPQQKFLNLLWSGHSSLVAILPALPSATILDQIRSHTILARSYMIQEGFSRGSKNRQPGTSHRAPVSLPQTPVAKLEDQWHMRSEQKNLTLKTRTWSGGEELAWLKKKRLIGENDITNDLIQIQIVTLLLPPPPRWS